MTAPPLDRPEVRPVLPDPLDLDPLGLDPRCGAPGCSRRPSLGALCRVHGDQLGQWLAELGADFAALEVGPAGARGGDAASGRQATKVKSRGTPVNLDAVALTDRRIAWLTDEDLDDVVDPVGRDPLPRALEVLAWWAAHVRAGRGLTAPARILPAYRPAPGPACAGRCGHLSCADRRPLEVPAALTVAGERRVLVTHLEWCCAQSWAGAMWRSIRQLWAALKVARGDDAGRPVATCRRRETLLDEVCGGPVWAERGVGWCGRCSHTWTGRELLELTKRGAAA